VERSRPKPLLAPVMARCVLPWWVLPRMYPAPGHLHLTAGSGRVELLKVSCPQLAVA
jgi:hypothetical protein